MHFVHDMTHGLHRRVLLLLLGIDAVNAICERVDQSLKRLKTGRISQRVKSQLLLYYNAMHFIYLKVLPFHLLLDYLSFLLCSLYNCLKCQSFSLETLIVFFNFLLDFLLKLGIELVVAFLIIVHTSVGYDYELFPKK